MEIKMMETVVLQIVLDLLMDGLVQEEQCLMLTLVGKLVLILLSLQESNVMIIIRQTWTDVLSNV